MKVLFVCPFVPWPLVNGGKIRTFNLIKSASKHAEIHLRILNEPGADHDARAALEPWCASLEFFDRSPPSRLKQLLQPKIERWFHSKDLINSVQKDLASGEFGLLHIDELLLARITKPGHKTPVVQHHHKLDTVLYNTLHSGASPMRKFDLWKLRRLERESTRRYRHHLFCSEGDAALLSARYGGLDTGAVPSGFAPEDFRPSQPPVARDPERLLFLGSMDYGPNVDGTTWFVSEVLPLIRAERPALTLDIVGANPVPEVKALAGQGVRVLGRVPEVSPHLEGAAAMLVPLRIGGGTRLKIVEALAMNTPVVSTTIGAEGLGLVHKEHLLLADTPETFARATLELLDDPTGAAKLGQTGADYIKKHYRWDVLAEELVDYWERVAFSGKYSASR